MPWNAKDPLAMRGEACRALTLMEVLVLIFFLSLLFGVLLALLPPLSRPAELPRKPWCRNQLRQIAMGHLQYVEQFGGGKYFSWPSDKFNGGEWNASLYWCGIIGDPSIFECPSATDDTLNGEALGTTFKTIAATEAAYAGRNSARGATPPDAEGIVPGAIIIDNFPSSAAMASDDTDSTERHHEEGGHVAFFDAHVEWVAMATFAIGVACPGYGKTDCLNN